MYGELEVWKAKRQLECRGGRSVTVTKSGLREYAKVLLQCRDDGMDPKLVGPNGLLLQGQRTASLAP